MLSAATGGGIVIDSAYAKHCMNRLPLVAAALGLPLRRIRGHCHLVSLQARAVAARAPDESATRTDLLAAESGVPVCGTRKLPEDVRVL